MGNLLSGRGLTRPLRRSFPKLKEDLMHFRSIRIIGLSAAFLLAAATARAEIKTETIDYKQGDAALEGYLAYDDGPAKRPGIIVAHEWAGLTSYEKMRSDMLAKMGYVAFAADIFGKGIRPASVPDRMTQIKRYLGDRALFRARMNAALDLLRQNAHVDGGKIAAVGFCFGGAGALELARTGANLGGLVLFHGDFSNPTPQDDRNIKARVLVLHGADDPLVPKAEVDAFEKQMTDAKIDWQAVLYSGTLHAFSNPETNDPAHGAQYNERSATRGWTATQDFLGEVFASR
jgi:dienelactone hydrolase